MAVYEISSSIQCLVIEFEYSAVYKFKLIGLSYNVVICRNEFVINLFKMNLASQSVLEGLNACFDHRHNLFIPELNRTFDIDVHDKKTRFFACQNPCSHGGNRRKLPKSFVNRFTSVCALLYSNTNFEIL